MKFVLLLFNIQKNKNFGNLIRTANVFGVEEVCVVGRKGFSTHGNQNTKLDTQFRHFYKMHEAFDFYAKLNYEFVGVEIGENFRSINTQVFSRDSVFILGNETSGIQAEIIAQCDYCVYIPQFGSGASLNVNVACGIVLNAFVANKGQHNKIVDAKFVAP